MATRRRILLLVTDLQIGGTPTVVRELALRLRSDDVHVEVACLAKWGPTATVLREGGVEVTPFDARGSRDFFRAVRRLRMLVKNHSIDTVVSFLVHANVVAHRALGRQKNVRLFQSIQTVQPRPRWHWVAQRFAAKSAERVVVPSAAIAEFAGHRSGIPANRFVVIPNAVDPAEFGQNEVFHRIPMRAGYIGRLDPMKRPAALLPAAKVLHDQLTLTYFGDGPANAALKAEVEALGIASVVRFAGFAASSPSVLSQLDVLWLASPVEGFGLVLIEAMAAGVPVVALRAGGTRDVLLSNENSLTTDDPGDWPFFATATRRLRDDSALRARLIAGGLRTVRERFTWAKVLPQYRALLDLG